MPSVVSPGSATGTEIEDRCPTFSWGAVREATSYEIVVYRVGPDTEEGDPVLRETFAGLITSWTPPLGACLERGHRYAWSVRASGAGVTSGWSVPSLFDVIEAPSEAELEQALEVVRRYLGRPPGGAEAAADSPRSRGRGPISENDGASSTGPGLEPDTAALVGGDPAVQVNGAAVMTTASFGAGLCAALTYRYVDQGDGTVLDCNTGLIWLKDATCLGTGTWGSSGTNGTAQKAVAQLNLGSQFNCSEYTPGTYTDWQVPAMSAMCGLWDGSCTGTGCCSAVQGVVNGSFTNPAVANAVGDGKWTTGDAFVGVHFGPNVSDGYWSATSAGAGSGDAWGVLLNTGHVIGGPTAIPGRVWAVRTVP